MKIASFKGLATGRPSRPAIVAVATDIDGEVQHADALLTEFVQQFVAPSTTCLVQPEMATCRARDRERGASGE